MMFAGVQRVTPHPRPLSPERGEGSKTGGESDGKRLGFPKMDCEVNRICVAELVERQTSEVLKDFRSRDGGKMVENALVFRRWRER